MWLFQDFEQPGNEQAASYYTQWPILGKYILNPSFPRFVLKKKKKKPNTWLFKLMQSVWVYIDSSNLLAP